MIITSPNGDKPPHGNFRIILIVTGFLLAAYFAIETPEHRGEFIYLTAVMVKTWHGAGDSNKSEEIDESDPLEKLEQSDKEKSHESEEQSDKENADDDGDKSKL